MSNIELERIRLYQKKLNELALFLLAEEAGATQDRERIRILHNHINTLAAVNAHLTIEREKIYYGE